MSDSRPTPYTNGSTPAPHAKSGAVFVASAQSNGAARATPRSTVFPAEIAGAGIDGLFYNLGRAQIAAFPVANWVVGAAIVLAMTLALQGAPWGWLGLAMVAASVVLRVLVWRRARRDYVRFAPTVQGAPMSDAATLNPLPANQKLAVHVTGCLEVGNKVQHFTLLPGFYRSFATREHALLCLCRGGRRLYVASWPESEVGLWYAFARPEAIRRIERGFLHFGAHERPSLALEVDAIPTRRRPRRRTVETIIVSADDVTLGRIEADLRLDAPQRAVTQPALLQDAAGAASRSSQEARL